MSKVFLLGANVEIDTEIKTVGIGQIIRMEGYEYDNYVVADITHDSYGYSYRLINLRTYEYVTAETIRPLSQKFGIGFYYDDTAPQFFGTDELRAVIHKAEKIADAEIRRKEQEREERQRTKQRGMELLRRIVPADVRAVIIAELHEDDSDPMTDYYGYRNIRTVILGFSHKTRVDFAEMRRAAAHFPDTAYLAEYNREYEHREKYSMGHGYWLGENYYSGWIICKEECSNAESLIDRYAYAAGCEGGIYVPEIPQTAMPEHLSADADSQNITVEIIDYSEKAIAVFGDTKPLKEILRSLGGRFSPRLQNNGQTAAGWVFPKRNEQKVRQTLAAYLAA